MVDGWQDQAPLLCRIDVDAAHAGDLSTGFCGLTEQLGPGAKFSEGGYVGREDSRRKISNKYIDGFLPE